MITVTIKTPVCVKVAQQNYIKEAEEQAIISLINQFNQEIVKTIPDKFGAYTLTLYVSRPAGITDISNIQRRFIKHCVSSGWLVSNLSYVSECQFKITVTSAF